MRFEKQLHSNFLYKTDYSAKEFKIINTRRVHGWPDPSVKPAYRDVPEVSGAKVNGPSRTL